MTRAITSHTVKIALFTLLIGTFAPGIVGCETGYERERLEEREGLEGEGLEEREGIEEGTEREVERDD